MTMLGRTNCRGVVHAVALVGLGLGLGLAFYSGVAQGQQITAAQQSAIKSACRSDFMSHCSSVSPGGIEALQCLQKNTAALSPACQSAVTATTAVAPAAAAVVARPVPAAPTDTVVEVPGAGPTPQQMSAIKHTCAHDFKTHCTGVAPGGPEALACLQRNEPRLSPDCKISLADIADSISVAVPPPAVPVAATAAPHRRLPPGITPAGRVLRRVIERNE